MALSTKPPLMLTVAAEDPKEPWFVIDPRERFNVATLAPNVDAVSRVKEPELRLIVLNAVFVEAPKSILLFCKLIRPVPWIVKSTVPFVEPKILELLKFKVDARLIVPLELTNTFKFVNVDGDDTFKTDEFFGSSCS